MMKPFARACFFILCVFGTYYDDARAETVAMQGCAKAHCDAGNTDLANLQGPQGPIGQVWYRHDLPGEIAGSANGLGCSADGTQAVCTFRGPASNVAGYDFNGNRTWDSGLLIDQSVSTSAPLILEGGDVVIGDDRRLYRFDSSGRIIWSTPLPLGGSPISPVLTQSGAIVLSCIFGPVYAIDAGTGSILSYMFIRRDESDPGFFDTQNTPAVVGDRVYISMRHTLNGGVDPDYIGALVALDIDAGVAEPKDRIKVAWQYEFGAPSKSSPLVAQGVVMFDGARPEPGGPEIPQIFGIMDQGSSASVLWEKSTPKAVFASFAADPRGGFWHSMLGSPIITRRDSYTGNVMEIVNVDQLVGERGVHIPSSAMTVAGTAESPVLIFGVVAARGDSYVIAVDLTTLTLRWKYPIAASTSEAAQGQFPLLTDGIDTRVVFSTDRGGVRALGSAD